jgi:hypothetical protein
VEDGEGGDGGRRQEKGGGERREQGEKGRGREEERNFRVEPEISKILGSRKSAGRNCERDCGEDRLEGFVRFVPRQRQKEF